MTKDNNNQGIIRQKLATSVDGQQVSQQQVQVQPAIGSHCMVSFNSNTRNSSTSNWGGEENRMSSRNSPVSSRKWSDQQQLPIAQQQIQRPQPAVQPFQQQVNRPQGFKMQTSQTKDTLANNKANRSEFNAWLDYFGTMGEKPPDRTKEPPDIITAAQEYLASRIELSIT